MRHLTTRANIANHRPCRAGVRSLGTCFSKLHRQALARLQQLASLPKLHTLFLSSFENLNDGTIAELSVLPQLETLVLAPVYSTNPKTTVTDAGLESMKRLHALKTLYVGYHGKFTLPVDRLRELLPNVDVKAPQDGVPARN